MLVIKLELSVADQSAGFPVCTVNPRTGTSDNCPCRMGYQEASCPIPTLCKPVGIGYNVCRSITSPWSSVKVKILWKRISHFTLLIASQYGMKFRELVEREGSWGQWMAGSGEPASVTEDKLHAFPLFLLHIPWEHW